jgi:TolA-binding protein
MKRCMAMVSALAALLVLVVAVAPASALDEADRLFMVGQRALADRFFPVARRSLEQFVAQYPNDARHPRALLMLGQARLALNDPQSALEAFTRAAPGQKAPAEVLENKLWQAEAMFKLSRFAEARTAYDEVVRTDAASPLAPEALYGFARSELALKNVEPSVAALREFLNTWPDHARAPAATLELARGLVDLKRLPEAQSLLTPFATKYQNNPQVPDAQFLLGWIKLNNGDQRGGAADLRAFLAANPNHEQAPEARRLITGTVAKAGSRSEKEDAYKTLMAEDPPRPEGLREAFEIAGQLSRPKDADAAWRKLKAQFPDDPNTRRLALDLATTSFKQQNYKDAGALGLTATQSDESRVRAEGWLVVGESELKLKRFPQAAKAFEAVGAITDVEPGARYRALAGLGLAREQQKDWKAALAAYEAVAGRSPDQTLRDWARQRAAAMKDQLKSPAGTPAAPKRSEPAKPGDKPTGR